MDVRYLARRAVALSLALVVVSVAATAAAQYMYLDANGDGVHTSADVFPATGSATFDIWLITNQNRDGTPVICAQDSSAEMTINSYSFILHVRDGEVAWSGFMNRMTPLTIDAGKDSSSTDYTRAWASATAYPAGAYRLATLTATPISGSPSIEIVDHTAIEGAAITGFGSHCGGANSDNTPTLGTDWFDVAGLVNQVPGDAIPDLFAPVPMTVNEGQTAEQVLHATDADGQPLTFSAISPPSFVAVTTTDPGSGTATGLVRLTPGFQDAGSYTTTLYASDGQAQGQATLKSTIVNVNRAPILEQPDDMTVAAGAITNTPLVASDPDGGKPYLLKASGPDFMSVNNEPTDWGMPPAGVRLSPAYGEEGTYSGSVRATDGSLYDEKSFQIVVTAGNYPPQIAQLPNVTIAAGVVQSLQLIGTDPDGDPLTFSLQHTSNDSFFPSLNFITVTTVNAGSGTALGQVELKPTGSDLGWHEVTIVVFDGEHETTMTFDVIVTPPGPSGETAFTVSGDPGDPVLGGSSTRRGGLDGSFQAWSLPQGVHIDFVANPPAPDFELATAPARRAWCVSAQEAWSFEFQAPLGDTLRPGVYENAERTPTAGAPGLHVVSNCGNCGVVSGRFEVKQLHVEGGVVRAFAATFEQECNASGAKLRGEVRFGTTPPIFLAIPANGLAGVGDKVEFRINSAPVDTGQISFTGDLPSGAQLVTTSWSPPLRVHMFSWTPGFSDVGVHRVVIRAVTSAGDTASSYCDLEVRARNAVTARLDPNQIGFLTSNRGAFATDLRDGGPGWTYPKAMGLAASKLGALWLGAKVNGEVRVALGGSPSEFVPGPMTSGSSQPFDPRFKNYRVVRGAPTGTDVTEWPRAEGAPVDTYGNPLQKGDVTVWSVYNDATASAHAIPGSGSAPLGAEVRQLTWSLAHPGALDQSVFLRFQIRNAGSQPWDSAYAAVRLDADVAHLVGDVLVPHNDRVGCDSALALGFAYSSSPYYPDGAASPAFGAALLRGPKVSNDSGTRELGMTSFRHFSGELPFDTSSPYALQAYRLMQGLQADGEAVHQFDDPSQPVTSLDFSGDPVTQTGWLDTAQPDNRRQFLLATGPFNLGPGEEDTVEVALVVGRGAWQLASITKLREAVAALRSGAAEQTNHAPSIRAPAYYTFADTLDVNEGELLTFLVGLSDFDQDILDARAMPLPQGASFTVYGWPSMPSIQDAYFRWTPGYDQAGVYPIVFTATDALGASGADTLCIRVHDVNTTPVAHAGGPYFGPAGMAVHFEGTTSSDADGDPLTGTWAFGDGSGSAGLEALHVYAEPGNYPTVFAVSDGVHSASDTTLTSIAPPVQVRASVRGGLVRLAAPGPQVQVTLEIDEPALLESLQQASFSLQSHGTGEASAISCMEGKTELRSNAANGHNELVVVFRREDIRALFCNLPEGRSSATATLTAMVGTDAIMVAPISLTIEATHRSLAVLVAPNPINPRGVLTFTTTRPGRARVALFDVRGRLVRRLFESEMIPVGYHDVPIDGKDEAGHPIASGLYFYRIDAAEGVTSGRLTVLK